MIKKILLMSILLPLTLLKTTQEKTPLLEKNKKKEKQNIKIPKELIDWQEASEILQDSTLDDKKTLKKLKKYDSKINFNLKGGPDENTLLHLALATQKCNTIDYLLTKSFLGTTNRFSQSAFDKVIIRLSNPENQSYYTHVAYLFVKAGAQLDPNKGIYSWASFATAERWASIYHEVEEEKRKKNKENKEVTTCTVCPLLQNIFKDKYDPQAACTFAVKNTANALPLSPVV